MAYNLVTDLYTAHTGATTEPEIDDVCSSLAAMILAVVGPLPLTNPLRGASGAAVAKPPALPWAVVLPAAGSQEEKLDQLHVAAWHTLDLVFLFGPPDLPERALLPNLDYLYAAQLAISENRNLDSGVHRLAAPSWDWARVEYAGQEWAGLVLHCRAQTAYGMRAAW